MIISVINHTNGKIGDGELQGVIRAINRQKARKRLEIKRQAGMARRGIRYKWFEATMEEGSGKRRAVSRSV